VHLLLLLLLILEEGCIIYRIRNITGISEGDTLNHSTQICVTLASQPLSLCMENRIFHELNMGLSKLSVFYHVLFSNGKSISLPPR